jgi:hypothetical protein
MTMSRNTLAILVIVFLSVVSTGSAQQQTLGKTLFSLSNGDGVPLPSNSVSHLLFAKSTGTLWAGTSRGLAKTSDPNLQLWQDFGGIAQFAQPGIFALDVHGDSIWAATGYSKEVDNSSVQTGSGYAYSTDNGVTWNSRPQPLDASNDSVVMYGANRIHFLPIVVPEQNVTFDLALTDSLVWIASWSSGIRKSSDLGQTWQRIVLPKTTASSIRPSDSLGDYVMDPRRDNNFLGFSVLAMGRDTVWAGTAGGVNVSTDRGSSWRHISVDNQTSSIAGDWIVAIAAQPLTGHTRVWTTNWPGDGPNQQYAVSYTDDFGATWVKSLRGLKVYAFAFHDSIAYAAADDGVYRTSDGGISWLRSGTVEDPHTGQRISSSTFYSVATIADTVIGAGPDGLARTIDNAAHPFGSDWTVIRSYVPSVSPSFVYAYPNPFAPSQQVTRFHYTTGTSAALVNIELFDFGMNRVRTVLYGASRIGESDDLWNGLDDHGRLVPNGVYFYRITIGSDKPAWGKILVVD